MKDFFLIFLLTAGLWYWWDTMRCKEISRRAGHQACSDGDVQFLDDTVEIKKIWLGRNRRGRIHLCRLFFFEFTSDGTERYSGRIVMLGKQVAEVEMDAYRI